MIFAELKKNIFTGDELLSVSKSFLTGKQAASATIIRKILFINEILTESSIKALLFNPTRFLKKFRRLCPS